MSDKLDQKIIEHQDTPTFAIETTKEEAEILGSVENNSMSMEDALESHKKRKGKVLDAAETAKQGIFLDMPEFICRGVD